jgi:aldehyde dehydrogenase (NAD+)
VFKDPFGVTLHIAPWNYPFQLSLTPIVSAVAAGNTVVLKPSEYSAKTSALLENMIAKVFEKDHVTVIQGDATVSQELLRHRWDYIFFTGSVAVGKIVAKAAAEYMTPTTLELGGKSPCIVDASAPLDLSARRIVWGKFLNAGQTCIAPDYVLVHKSSYPSFLEALKKAIENAYSQNADQSEDYGRLIHEKHVDRMQTYLNEAKVYYGGSFDRNTRYVQPTLITDVTREHQVMQDEIFGPLLPVIPYETEDEIDQWLEELPNPLAFYVFSKNKKWAEELLVKHRFGQAAVNDTIMMIAESNLPFGGVGESGHGVYHAKYGFDTFSREKPVLYRATWLDVPLRYAPFKNKLGALKKLLALNRWLS